MRMFVAAMLVVVGLIHLLPLTGVLGAERLALLYGLDFGNPDLAILMRHRAVLFGLLGLFVLYAAWRRALQPLAFVAGFLSIASFLLLAHATGGYNAAIARVVLADWVALACLLLGAVAAVIASRRAGSGGPAGPESR